MLLLAGCSSPPADPTPSVAPTDHAPAPTYDLTIRVSQERPDGPALSGVEVQAFLLDATGVPGSAIPRSTDSQGVARFSFDDQVRIALRATAPGWTVEGLVLDVGDHVAAVGGPAVVSERDLFLPLYHTELSLASSTTLMTGTVRPSATGSLEAPVATADLVFPEGLATQYLARLSAADVRVQWQDTASNRAHLSAALAWDDEVWVRGEAPAPGLAPGPREAAYSGALPVEGRPAALEGATLQAAAVLESAAVGDVPLTFEVRLAFTGSQPPGLPKACHSMVVCVPDLPFVPVA